MMLRICGYMIRLFPTYLLEVGSNASNLPCLKDCQLLMMVNGDLTETKNDDY